MEMNIAVCDDQPEVLDVVENMLREIPEVERVETYQDIRHMRDGFEDGKRPDVLIMDICHEYNTKIPETAEIPGAADHLPDRIYDEIFPAYFPEAGQSRGISHEAGERGYP